MVDYEIPNPAPATPAEEPPPQYRLFSIPQITGGSLFGSPLAGVYMMARNYKLTGDEEKSRLTLILGIICIAVFFGLIFLLPESTPDALISALSVGIIAIVASNRQSDLIKSHFARGGEKASFGSVAGISLLSMLIVGIAIFGTIFLLPEDKIDFGSNSEIYYENGATEDDARALSGYMQQSDFFTGDEEFTLTVQRESGTVVVLIPLIDDAWNEPETVEAYQYFTNNLSASEVFDSVKVVLVDFWENPKKTLVPVRLDESLKVIPSDP